MPTPTTTIAAIREALEAAIVALTPASHSGVRFQAHREEEDFRTWATGNPAAAFRRFSLLSFGGHAAGDVANLEVRELSTQLGVVVAYPEHWGQYGAENRQDLEDIIEEDAEQLRVAVGLEGYGAYPDGAWPTNDGDDWELERADGVTFLSLTATVQYYRSRAA